MSLEFDPCLTEPGFIFQENTVDPGQLASDVEF